MTTTVCILTSGKGTRMGPLGEVLNKSLLPYQGKAILSHIIERFPNDTRFVISLGYKQEQLCSYLHLHHADSNIDFVEVDRFEGPGSGPGYSLLQCAQKLQCAFYFVSCDTLWDSDLPQNPMTDWMGVSCDASHVGTQYCNMKVEAQKITDFADKKVVDKDESYRAFTGLCYIHNYETFWKGLSNPDLSSGEHQVSSGIANLIQHHEVDSVAVDWTDIGTFEQYKNLLCGDDEFDFSKVEEFLYIDDKKVSKFFAKKGSVENRVCKAALKPNVFPKNIISDSQFFSYDLAPGKTLYEYNHPAIFKKFLHWCKENLWSQEPNIDSNFSESCRKFYYDKTQSRLEMYFQKTKSLDHSKNVNGIPVYPVHELLDKVDWDQLYCGIPSFIHGDLQFDNVIYNDAEESFTLIDWRDEFGGIVEYGDLYYDLSKLYGGIMLNYRLIKKNLFSYSKDSHSIWIESSQSSFATQYQSILEDFVTENNYDLHKVKTIAGLIYLNMAPLHEAPFDEFLVAKGQLHLTQVLT